MHREMRELLSSFSCLFFSLDEFSGPPQVPGIETSTLCSIMGQIKLGLEFTLVTTVVSINIRKCCAFPSNGEISARRWFYQVYLVFRLLKHFQSMFIFLWSESTEIAYLEPPLICTMVQANFSAIYSVNAYICKLEATI